ncbi:hypothetical protein Lumi_083 [Xylophilus phage Lumi]|nr:hypothetical protein Lumi_083 [Xylophilus phage Lumi]
MQSAPVLCAVNLDGHVKLAHIFPDGIEALRKLNEVILVTQANMEEIARTTVLSFQQIKEAFDQLQNVDYRTGRKLSAEDFKDFATIKQHSPEPMTKGARWKTDIKPWHKR